jgi:hypothetical protein
MTMAESWAARPSRLACPDSDADRHPAGPDGGPPHRCAHCRPRSFSLPA